MIEDKLKRTSRLEAVGEGRVCARSGGARQSNSKLVERLFRA